MDTEKIVLKVISKELKINKNKIDLNSKIEDLAQDSIQLFELIIALEKEFNQKTQYENLIKIVTVNDVIKYINKLKIGT